jgi:hypothetical protein
MNDLRLEVVGPETPDRATLELLAEMLNREFTPKAGVSFYFEVNPEQTGISIHFRCGEEYCVLNAVTTVVGTTIEMEMPSGTVAIFTRDHLDRTSPLWNN